MTDSLARRSGGKFTSRVRLRDTHPHLYGSLTTLALIFVALGFNFLLTTPTFQQYDIPKNVIGSGFMVLGLAYLVVLNLLRSLRVVRMLLIGGIAYMIFWGIGTTETFFEGTSSLQLFILYAGLAALQVPLLLEPFVNPATANGKDEE